MPTRSYRRERTSSIWPGFVDAISALLIIVIFLLMVFTIAQFFLSEILTGRNDALDRLNRQIAELGEVLAIEKQSNETLRQEITQLSNKLQTSISTRDNLLQSIATITVKRDYLVEALKEKSEEQQVDREKMRVQLVTLKSLKNDIVALKKVRKILESNISALTSALEKNKTDLTTARDRSKRLEAKLVSAEERTALAQKKINKKDIRLIQMQASAAKSAETLKAERALSEKARDRVTLLNQQITLLRQQLARISSALEASEAKAKSQNVQIVNLGKRLNEALINKVEELTRLRSEFSGKLREALGNISALTSALEKNKTDLTTARDRSKRLEAKLVSAEERTALAQKRISKKDIRLIQMQASVAKSAETLKAERALSEKARDRITLLNQQIALLRQQLARISSALEASEAKAKSQNVQIVNLGERLNAALLTKVEELTRLRSEFFGKLREALGNIKGIRIEGDRFVFQSEVLFPSSSTDLFGPGEKQIIQLAKTLKDITSRIPKDVDWILRVDGHTDDRPIKTIRFPSNWELSSARAIAVVKKLVAQGIPPHRLVATGFGEFRPLSSRPGQAGLSRNRRIEFKLTGR